MFGPVWKYTNTIVAFCWLFKKIYRFDDDLPREFWQTLLNYFLFSSGQDILVSEIGMGGFVRDILTKVGGNPQSLTCSWILSSKCVCWDSRDIRDWNAVNQVFGSKNIVLGHFWGLRTEDSLFTSYGWPHFHPLWPQKSSKILINWKKSSKSGLQDCTTCATLGWICPE